MNVNIPSAAMAHCELPITVEQMVSGTGATLWHVQSGSGDYVWRQFRPQEWTPGADHDRERRVMSILQDRPWVPEVASWQDNGVLLGWQTGDNPRPDTLTASARRSLLNHVLEMWQTPIDQEPAYDYAALVRAYGNRAPDTPEMRALRCRLMTQLAHWPVAMACLTHHDLHRENLLFGDAGWCILDWEYAAPGNPWLDAVALDRWLQLTSDEKAMLAPVLAPWALHCDSWRGYRDWLYDMEALWHAARPDGAG